MDLSVRPEFVSDSQWSHLQTLPLARVALVLGANPCEGGWLLQIWYGNEGKLRVQQVDARGNVVLDCKSRI